MTENQQIRAQKAERAEKGAGRFLKGALVGITIGGAAGGLGGYFLARKKLLKKAKEDCKRAYKKGYDKGADDAEKEAQEWFDENVVVVDSDRSEDIQKAIAEHDAKQEAKSEEAKGAEKPVKKDAPSVVTSEEPGPALVEKLNRSWEQALDKAGEDMGEWDLSIDGEEAQARSEERQRYIELVEKYMQFPEDGPMHISRKDFEEECYLDKDWVTYYAGDNVFASDKDADTKMDSVANFGVTDGNELFTGEIIRIGDDGEPIEDEDNDDPNVTYIRNYSKNTVYEITRTKKTFKSLETGEGYLNGESG